MSYGTSGDSRLTKNEKREAAREKARILREEQKKKDRRTKLLLQGGIILASLAIVAFLILATFLGLNIGAVVLIHEGSTLVVVANALRLLNFERGKEHHGIDHEDKPSP